MLGGVPFLQETDGRSSQLVCQASVAVNTGECRAKDEPRVVRRFHSRGIMLLVSQASC
jgi:hypothetical protein